MLLPRSSVWDQKSLDVEVERQEKKVKEEAGTGDLTVIVSFFQCATQG